MGRASSKSQAQARIASVSYRPLAHVQKQKLRVATLLARLRIRAFAILQRAAILHNAAWCLSRGLPPVCISVSVLPI